MSCSSPLSWADLVAYWAGDLAPSQSESMEEHWMGCSSCAAQAERVSAVVEGLRGLIPPIVSRAKVTLLRERGMRIVENSFVPGRTDVVFPREADLLVHRLTGFDLSHAVRVRVAVKVESSGATLMEEPMASFDVDEGVLIACQQHFSELPPDVLVEVTAIDTSGGERLARYSIPHVFER